MAGIYIHIPFCKQACNYCDFHFSTSLKMKDSFVDALLKEIDLSNFNFSTIFLDPPRSGIDSRTLKEVSSFNQIIYISCGFQSLMRDLKELNKTHKIKSGALFDQFPYTNHTETGFILEKR